VSILFLPFPCVVKDFLEFFVSLNTKLFLIWVNNLLLLKTLNLVIVFLASLNEQCFIFTVLSIVWMCPLVFANVSLPTKISSIDRWYEQVHLIRRLMLQMHINSLFSFQFIYFHQHFLAIGRFLILLGIVCSILINRQAFCGNVVVFNYLIPFYFTICDLFWFFKIVMLFLLSKEALDLMVLHCECLTRYFRQVVNKSNHRFRALRIKLIIITSLNLRPLVHTFLLGLCERVLSNTILNVIPQISYKSHSII